MLGSQSKWRLVVIGTHGLRCSVLNYEDVRCVPTAAFFPCRRQCIPPTPRRAERTRPPSAGSSGLRSPVGPATVRTARADSGFGGLKQKGSAAGSRQVPGGTRGPPGRRPPRASTPLHLHPPHARDHRGEQDHQSCLDRPVPRFAFASFRRRKPVTSRDVKASGPGGAGPGNTSVPRRICRRGGKRGTPCVFCELCSFLLSSVFLINSCFFFFVLIWRNAWQNWRIDPLLLT